MLKFIKPLESSRIDIGFHYLVWHPKGHYYKINNFMEKYNFRLCVGQKLYRISYDNIGENYYHNIVKAIHKDYLIIDCDSSENTKLYFRKLVERNYDNWKIEEVVCSMEINPFPPFISKPSFNDISTCIFKDNWKDHDIYKHNINYFQEELEVTYRLDFNCCIWNLDILKSPVVIGSELIKTGNYIRWKDNNLMYLGKYNGKTTLYCHVL